MPLRRDSPTLWMLAAAFWLATLALGLLLDQEPRRALGLGRQELENLSLLKRLRQELRGGAEGLLSGENMSPVDQEQLLGRGRSLANEAKQAGQSSSLILDAQPDIYQ